jgi:hypothetical protein
VRDRFPEAVQTEYPQREPQLVGARAARKLKPPVSKVHAAAECRAGMPRRARTPPRARRHAGRARSRPRTAGRATCARRAPVNRQARCPRAGPAWARTAVPGSVGAVDMQPHPLASAQLRKLRELVHRPGARRPGRGDHAEGLEPGVTIGADSVVDGSGDESPARVGRQYPQVRHVEAEHPPGSRNGSVCVLGRVRRRARTVRPDAVVRGRREGREVPDRAATHEDALRASRKTHPGPHPVDHRQLHGRRSESARPARGERVHAGSGEVGEWAHRVARAADPREEARMGSTLTARQDMAARCRATSWVPPHASGAAHPAAPGARRADRRRGSPAGAARPAAESRPARHTG